MTTEVTTDSPMTTEPKDGHVEKVLPHYLSTSSGSCHDACKYGFKDVSYTKVSKPFLKSGTTTLYKSRDLLRSVIDPVHRKQKSAVASVDSLDINKETPNHALTNEIQDTSQRVSVYLRRQTSSPAKLKHAPVKHLNPLQPQSNSPSAVRHLNRRLSEIVIPKDFDTLNMSSPRSNRKNSQTNTTEYLGHSLKHSADMKPKPSQTKTSVVLSPRQFSRSLGETIIKPKGSGFRRMNSLEDSSINKGSSSKIGEQDYSRSTQRRLNRRYSDIIIPKDLEHLLLSPEGGSSGRRNIEKNIIKETGTPKMGKNKSLVPEKVSSSAKSSVKKILSTQYESVNNLKKVPSSCPKQVESEHPTKEKVLEKTLYVIEPQAENLASGLIENDSITAWSSSSPTNEENEMGNGENVIDAHQSPPMESLYLNTTDSPLSSASPSSLSQSPASLSSEIMHGEDGASESYESEIDNQITVLGLEPKRSRRIRGVGSEDIDWSPSHLIFKSGRTVYVQTENTSPRRLKFRQGKVLVENQNDKCDMNSRNLRRLVSDSALYETKTEPVITVLKHQDVEEKKDGQSLFNNVIEETANKLVRTQKSKVKALVGAFETLISLQDTKSSETTSTSRVTMAWATEAA